MAISTAFGGRVKEKSWKEAANLLPFFTGGQVFQFDIRKILLVLFVVALPLISINIQRPPGETPWYLAPILVVSGSVQSGYSKLVFVIRDTATEYLNLINIKKDNRQLKDRLAQYESQLTVLEELRAENMRLSDLLSFKAREPMDLKAGKVIAFDLFSQYATIRINIGTGEGVLPGQAVVTPKGVVGTVLTAQEHASQVLVLTDRYSVIDAMVQRSRARGIVEGRTSTTSQLKYLQRTDDVQVGDIVVTSGLDVILPQG